MNLMNLWQGFFLLPRTRIAKLVFDDPAFETRNMKLETASLGYPQKFLGITYGALLQDVGIGWGSRLVGHKMWGLHPF